MKRIKILLSVLLSVISALLCFALAGCANKDGEYLSDSLEYELTLEKYSSYIRVKGSFDVTTPRFVKYEVKYTAIVYHNNTRIDSSEKTVTFLPSQDETRTVNLLYYIDYDTSGINENNLKLEITDVTVKQKEQDDKYQNYAIGFGTVGGAVLIACTVLFIVFKTKEKK